jgi:hypothetical protein
MDSPFSKQFDKKVATFKDFCKTVDDISTPGTDGNIKNKDAKGSDRNSKNIIMEMVHVDGLVFDEAIKRLKKDGISDDEISKMTKEQILKLGKESSSVVENKKEIKDNVH